ncbi:MAG: methyltransferase [Gammaproteobacteria bacterium]|nr:MAG: methyltransferase [Gammaproteobacteria bacterium]
MKKILISAVLACSFILPVHAEDALKTAISGSHRSAENVARDPARHPYETLTFLGIKPNMTVVELSPGGGWYTEILAPYLRNKGNLIAAGGDPESSSEYARKGAAAFRQKLDANPAVYDKVKVGIFEPGNKYKFAAPNSVDLVLTFRNIHNWAGGGDEQLTTAFKQVYDSLKPGGVFGVVDHRLPANKEANLKSGYLHEAYVIAQIEKAGFKLAEKSEINANPKDTADHKSGVWALPPSFANKDEDRAKYAAIGESDRMTLKFVKPSAKK